LGGNHGWFRKAGVTSWRDFARRAKALRVRETASELVVAVLSWDGRGFEAKTDMKYSISKDALIDFLRKEH